MRLGERELTRRTWAAGAWAARKFVRGSSTDSTIRAVWRPMPQKQVQQLPEGDRTRDPRVLISSTRLQVVKQGAGIVSDQVSPDGGTTWWELTAEKDGSSASAFVSPLNGWRYEALRVQESQ